MFSSYIHQVKTLISPILFTCWPLPSPNMERLLDQLFAYLLPPSPPLPPSFSLFPPTSPHPHLCPAPTSSCPQSYFWLSCDICLFQENPGCQVTSSCFSQLIPLFSLFSCFIFLLFQWWRSWSTQPVDLIVVQTVTTSTQPPACQQ